MSYRCILADPPWPESGGGRIKRGADRHYALLSPPKILETMLAAPVWKPHSDGCHLWLYSTNNYLPKALWLMEQLGFRYISNVAWAKMTTAILFSGELSGPPTFQPQKPGLGQYLRGQHELLLFGVMGKLPAVAKGSTLILAPRRKHSQKPEEAYTLIERVSPGPRLEMFARERREGWDSWGNEVPT
jgi:N6-adenosine-specific RNA methylase IME4